MSQRKPAQGVLSTLVFAGWVVCNAGVHTGCGYRAVGGTPPFGLTRIAIVPFVEQIPLGLSEDVSRELSHLLAEQGVQLVADVARAEGILRGQIVASRTATSPTSAGTGARVPAYELSVTVAAQLSDRQDQNLWTSSLSMREDFLDASSTEESVQALTTETNRRRALRRLSVRLAQGLHTRLLMAATTQQSPDRSKLNPPERS